MTHKQLCVQYCKDFLSMRDCIAFFSMKEFEHFYRKNNGPHANPFTLGTSAADFIIRTANPIMI